MCSCGPMISPFIPVPAGTSSRPQSACLDKSREGQADELYLVSLLSPRSGNIYLMYITTSTSSL
jgi:hypothetical protein